MTEDAVATEHARMVARMRAMSACRRLPLREMFGKRLCYLLERNGCHKDLEGLVIFLHIRDPAPVDAVDHHFVVQVCNLMVERGISRCHDIGKADRVLLRMMRSGQ